MQKCVNQLCGSVVILEVYMHTMCSGKGRHDFYSILKTLFTIVEDQFKKWLNLDVCVL